MISIEEATPGSQLADKLQPDSSRCSACSNPIGFFLRASEETGHDIACWTPAFLASQRLDAVVKISYSRWLCETCVADPAAEETFILYEDLGEKRPALCRITQVTDKLVFWESEQDDRFGDCEINDFLLNVLGEWRD